MTLNIWIIARLEFVTAIRTRWIQSFTWAFALICIAAAWSAGAMNDLEGAEGFARTSVALVPIVLTLVPLVALLLGVSGQATDAGEEAFLYTQPISRATIVVGKWCGEALALCTSVTTGMVVGALAIVGSAGWSGLAGFVILVAATNLLGLVFLSIAAFVVVMSHRRTTALGTAAFLWFCFVLLYDGAVLAASGSLSGRTGGLVLFGSVFGNPTDLARVLMLSVSGTPHVLGAAGEGWYRFLGGPASATVTAVAALLSWSVAPLALAGRLIRSRDL